MTDYYQIGLMVENEDERPDKIGDPFVWTPQAILDELNIVKGQVASLDADIARATNVRDVFRQSWGAFKTEFDTFYKSNESWASRFWGSAVDAIKEYRQRVAQWRDAFIKEGGKPIGPAMPDNKSSWKPWLIGAGVVAGMIATAVVVKEVGSTIKSFKKPQED